MGLVRRSAPALVVAALAALLVAAVSASPQAGRRSSAGSFPPIPAGPITTLPDFVGAAATPQPVDVFIAQNPQLAQDPFGYIHNDSWNSDVFTAWAPLGSQPEVFTSTLGASYLAGRQMTASMGVDTYGRIVAAIINASGVYMDLIDPVSLDVLCSFKVGQGGTKALGSAYWFLDPQDQVTVVGGTHTIMTLREGGTLSQPTWEEVPGRQYDLSTLDPMPVPDGDKLAGILADWKGRIWFQTFGAAGAPRVGIVDPAAWPRVRWVELGKGEQVWNGFAVDRDAAYVLTSEKLYRLGAGSDGKPRIVWSASYETTGENRSGQYSLGSGTSPTIFGGGKYVTITDNAEQLKVLVFRTAAKLRRGQGRLLAQLPVFTGQAGQGVEDSLLAAGTAIIAENNYGYSYSIDASGTMSSTPALPGLERLDIGADGKSLVKVWENDEVSSTSTPKLSTKTGLVYVLAREKDEQTAADVYYWTALDFRTGEVVWKKFAGTGQAFDNYWSALTVGRNGAIYVGCYGGLVAIKDGK